jgi:hypothetical protein|tara:strand:+ start:285 stop:485 length:201 start_codon:yes stop_codon:yes gene_type:complete
LDLRHAPRGWCAGAWVVGGGGRRTPSLVKRSKHSTAAGVAMEVVHIAGTLPSAAATLAASASIPGG